jgi:hypothetical protein
MSNDDDDTEEERFFRETYRFDKAKNLNCIIFTRQKIKL